MCAHIFISFRLIFGILNDRRTGMYLYILGELRRQRVLVCVCVCMSMVFV